MSEGIKGTIPCALFGGPLDGQMYGDLPDIGAPFTGATVSIPLETVSAHAFYTCHGDVPVDGFWQFFYERTEFPATAQLIDLPIPHPPLPTGTSVSAKKNEWDASIQVALARTVAVIAHRGQSDKAGAPYVTHAARVAARFDPTTRPLEHCAGWLHDVVEDSPMTLDDLWAAGIHPKVLALVALLTRRAEISTDEYYARIAGDPRAREVKAADIRDNLDPVRLQKLHPSVRARLRNKYARAGEALGRTKTGAK
ncbi:HD domain-containing protein [uncultured Microbacterium sp.]|uniref:HD domain-containing protein n=1 Tax=uncultured Microbacterium sp. TaxID=191216 RepID=UPI002632C389|nr:HD domain-containing protein [uncultured Microbacterium sp.]